MGVAAEAFFSWCQTYQHSTPEKASMLVLGLKPILKDLVQEARSLKLPDAAAALDVLGSFMQLVIAHDSGDLAAFDRQIDRCWATAKMIRIEEQLQAETRPNTAPTDHVTLRQCAGIIKKNKRTLERWKEDDTNFPTPEVIGNDGTADEWLWTTIRPYLESKSNRKLPDIFPAHRAVCGARSDSSQPFA